jgi:hypothetical protein
MLRLILIKILEFIKLIFDFIILIIKKIKYILRKHIFSDNNEFNLHNNFLNKKVYDLYEDEQIEKSYKNYRKYFEKAIFLNYLDLKKFSLKKSLENDPDQKKYYLEFGVMGGGTINFFSRFLNTKIYGFDSFEGLREDMLGADHAKGDFDLKGKIPHLKSNVVPIKGWVQDTLPKFLEEKNPLINFVHMDLDTYESSKFVLGLIKKYLDNKCVIVLDDFYNFAGWEMGESKAFHEVFSEDEVKFIAFSKFHRTVSVQILKKN